MNPKEEWTNPILDEIHEIRRQLLEEAGGSLDALVERLMISQERHGDRLVSRPPRLIKQEEKS